MPANKVQEGSLKINEDLFLIAKKECTVAITGFGGLNHPEAGRSIAETIVAGWNKPITIIGLIKNLEETSAWSCDALNQIIKIPATWDDSSKALEVLQSILSSQTIDSIIPGTNRDAYLISKFSNVLSRHGVKSCLPSISSFDLLTPESLIKLDVGDQIKIPKSIKIENKSNLDDLIRMIGFPLMVHSDHMPFKVIYDSSALDGYFSTPGCAKSELYVQEYIAGETYEVAGLFDHSGKLVASAMIRGIAMRKDGTVGAGAIVDDPILEKCFSKLGQALNWQGVLNVTLRLDPTKKVYRLVDVRAHLPSWSKATHWANKNLPEAYLNYVLNQTVEKQKKVESSSLFIISIVERAYPVDMMSQIQLEQSLTHNGVSHSNVVTGPAESSDQINVAITGLSSLDIVNPGLGVAHALKESGIVNDLIGIAYDHFDSGAYQKTLFNKVFKLNFDMPQSELLRNIIELNTEHKIDVLIPCLDGELEKFIAIKSKLQELGIACLLPDKNSLSLRCKKGLCALDSDWREFSIPACHVVSNKQELLKGKDLLGFPMVIKGPVSGCMIVHSNYDLETYYKYFESIGEKEVILQQKVEGDHYAVSVVCDQNHEVVSSLSIKKFARCDRGSTWGAVSASLPDLENSFAKFLKSIKWVGPAEGEFILDSYSNRFYLFEVNPRFTGWVYFTSQLGENQPQIAAELALSREITVQNELKKMFFVRSVEETKIPSRDLALFTTQGKCIHA